MKKLFLLQLFLFINLQLSFSQGQGQEVYLPGGDSYNLQAAINSINQEGTVIVSGDINLNYSITIPEGVTLRIISGNIITIPPTVNLIINGGIDAGFYQIFDVKPLAFLSGNPKIEYTVPHWWQLSSNNSNWSESIKQAVDFHPRVYFPRGTYNMLTTVDLKPFSSHYFYGEGKNSELKMIGNNYIFKMNNLNVNPSAYDNGLVFKGLLFNCTNGLQFNDNLTQFTDTITDHILNVSILNCFFESEQGGGTAIYMSKVFDSEIKSNKIKGFDIGINLRGSDINSISHNRILEFNKFAILDESFGTFGSQNVINHNDLLHYTGTANEGAFIKTFSLHVTIKNNYLENGISASKVRAMIDCSNYSSTYTIPNNKSFPYFISISENRIDVFESTADYTYLIQDDFASLFINDQSNINAYPPSKFINLNGIIFSDFIKSRFNTNKEKSINIQSATSFKEWNGYKTKSSFDNGYNGSLIIDSKHAPNAVTLTNEPVNTGLDVHPMYFKMKGGSNIAAYLIDLTQGLGQDGEKELFRRVKIQIYFRIKQLAPNSTLYMRADSNSAQGDLVYDTNLGTDGAYRRVILTPNIDYIKNLYIEPNNCDIEIKSIEIIPLLKN